MTMISQENQKNSQKGYILWNGKRILAFSLQFGDASAQVSTVVLIASSR